MDPQRLKEVNRLADLLWNDDAERWHDESEWRERLREACHGEDALIDDVCDFVRTAVSVKEHSIENVPANIGGHKIVGLIASGGMGTVYEGIFQGQGMQPRRVAIKVVNEKGPNIENTVRRLKAEINLLSGLSHTNIVHLYDAGTTAEGRPFFIMELIEGGQPIDRYCAERRLPLEELVVIIQKVCEGVQFLHESNLAHRDLKPGNILITKTGQPKILDFGLAAPIELQPNAPSFVNTEGSVRRLGTPGYMSVQQARGERPSPLDDIFAIGAVLSKLVREKHVENGRLRGALERIAEKCRREEPSERFQSAAELANALTVAILKNRGLVQRARLLARTKTGVAIALVGLVSLCAAGWHWSQLQRERTATAEKVHRGIARFNDHEALVKYFTEEVESLWIGPLKAVSGREGDLEQQFSYIEKLALAGDYTAKGIGAMTALWCRGGLMEAQTKPIESSPNPTLQSSMLGLRLLGIEVKPEDLELSAAELADIQNRSISSLLAKCSESRARQGVEWLKDLARGGQSAAAALVAMTLQAGTAGIPRDQWQAFEWAKMAAEGGSPDGFYLLGDLYIEGVAVPQDRERATENWAVAADYGNIRAQLKIANVRGYGLSRKLTMNKVEALKWAMLAASNKQGLLTNTPDTRDLFSGDARLKAAQLRDQLKQEVSELEADRASQLAAAWKARPSQEKKINFSMAEHDRIREAVLGPQNTVPR